MKKTGKRDHIASAGHRRPTEQTLACFNCSGVPYWSRFAPITQTGFVNYVYKILFFDITFL